MVKAVVFDLWDTMATSSSICGALRERLGPNVPENLVSTYEEATMLGKHTLAELAEQLCEALEFPITDDNLQFVKDVLTEARRSAALIPGIQKVIADLKQKYVLAVLSNNTSFSSDVLTTLGLAPYFYVELYSWQIGALKPRVEAFAAVCESLGLPAEDCLLVDDNPRNIAAAESFGMAGLQFNDSEQLRSDLTRHGLLQ